MSGADRYECVECGATFDDHAVAIDHVFDEHVHVEDYLNDLHNDEPPEAEA